MKRYAVFLLMLWAHVGAIHPALTQSPDLTTSYQQYKKLNPLGKYAEAGPYAQRVLELAKREFGPEHTAYAKLN